MNAGLDWIRKSKVYMEVVARVNVVSGEVSRLLGELEIAGNHEDFVDVQLISGTINRFESGIDAMISFPLPTPDLDNDQIWEVEIACLRGQPYRVQVSLPADAPDDLEERVIGEVISQLEDDAGDGDFTSLPSKIDYLGIWILRGRIHRIEGSVRAALDDVTTTEEDLRALRKYPDRLAKVEQLAYELGRKEPDVKEFRKKPVSAYLNPNLNFFWKATEKIEIEAKEAISRLAGLISSQQVVLTKQQAEESARFQRVVTVVGAAVLVPGLVAAIFGANVGFRGRGSTEAFWGMVLLMLGSGVASYGFLRSLESGIWKSALAKWPLSKLPEFTVFKQLLLIAVLALLLIGVGTAVLLAA